MPNSPIEPRAAVNVAVVRTDGRVLVTRRASGIRESGKWCLPGGHLEIGESWERAATRELQEETGLIASDLSLFGLYSDPSLTVAMLRPDRDHRVHFFCAAFLVRAWKGALTTTDEVDAWDWVAPPHLPEEMLRSHPIRIADALHFAGEVFVR